MDSLASALDIFTKTPAATETTSSPPRPKDSVIYNYKKTLAWLHNKWQPRKEKVSESIDIFLFLKSTFYVMDLI